MSKNNYVPMSLLPNCLPPVSVTSDCRYQKMALEQFPGQFRVPILTDNCTYQTGQLNHPNSSLTARQFLKYSQPHYLQLCKGCIS